MWPSLPYDKWKDTLDTLHMWTQIVGKVKLSLKPFQNQWWQVGFYVTPLGMTTGRIPYNDRVFTVDFNFIHHKIHITTNEAQQKTILLKPISVAEFYKEFMDALSSLDISVTIKPIPVEFAEHIPFTDDTKHASYDKEYVEKWSHIQLRTSILFDKFRSLFCGKSSPVQFFWGSFDLNGTRFSGKKATPPKPEGPLGKMMQLAENEENFTFGFWPGDIKFPHPAFYSYHYPELKGSEKIQTGSSFAYFHEKLSEHILPYEEIRKTKNPEKEIMNFLTTTYEEYARLANWDTKALEETLPQNASTPR